VILLDSAVACIAGERDIHKAAENGDIGRVRDLVIADPACVNEKNEMDEDTYQGCDARSLRAFAKEGGILVLF
jgi:hypothetical protein